MSVLTTTAVNNANNDFIISNGDFAMVEDKQAYANIIRSAILTSYGEVQYNQGFGIPYFRTVFENPQKIPLWASYVKKVIKSFPFVIKIKNFEYSVNYQQRKIVYSIDVETIDGSVGVSSND